MNRKKIIFYIFSIVAVFFLLTFFISAKSIGESVKNKCEIAQEKYEKDCVESLMELIEDEDIEYEEKNRAIWVLGQLGDKKALPLLQKYYIGYDDEKIKRAEALSQYELYKAIKLLNGGFNVTAFVWR